LPNFVPQNPANGQYTIIYMNTFGNIFRLTTFGESHGAAIGGVIDGMPSGIDVDEAFIQSELSRRRPGQSGISTPRNESDRVEILSGVFEGKTTGTPIGFAIRNENQHSKDYSQLKDVFRPSHADFTYQRKYGIRDYRGGGRQSARETAARVAAGAFAKLALQKAGVEIEAYTSQIGSVEMERGYRWYGSSEIESNAVRCPDSKVAALMENEVKNALADGDSVGGIVSCIVRGCPVGLGEPVFGKFHAAMAAAQMSINAARGFELGDGFEAASMRGSQYNDPFTADSDGAVTMLTNHNGGVLGGITCGSDVTFRMAFKPVPTISRQQQTVDIDGRQVTVAARGRHDPCVVPRAVPVVEAMAAIVTLDFLLLRQSNGI
jgi:chorismate synthase